MPPPSGRTGEEEYDALAHELRSGGFTEEQLQRAEDGLRRAGNGFAAGLQSSGPFEYVMDGSSTWVTYPVSTTAEGRTTSQYTEAFDGTTTVRTNETEAIVLEGDGWTFTAHPVWLAVVFGKVPGWLHEVSAVGNGSGETVTFEGEDKSGLRHRLIIEFRSLGRTGVASVDEGYLVPICPSQPGQSSFQRHATAARSEDGSRIDLAFYLRGAPDKRVTIDIDSTEPEGTVEPPRSIAAGSPDVDMRLGPDAPVNYNFAGTLPEVEALAARPEGDRAPASSLAVGSLGMIGLVFAAWLWKRK